VAVKREEPSRVKKIIKEEWKETWIWEERREEDKNKINRIK